MTVLFRSPADLSTAIAALRPLLGDALVVAPGLNSRGSGAPASGTTDAAHALYRWRDRVKGSARIKRWWPVAVAILAFSMAAFRGFNLTAWRKVTPAQTERMPDPAELESLPCPQRLDAWMGRCVPACTPSCEWRNGAAVCDWRHPERDRGARACIDQCS